MTIVNVAHVMSFLGELIESDQFRIITCPSVFIHCKINVFVITKSTNVCVPNGLLFRPDTIKNTQQAWIKAAKLGYIICIFRTEDQISTHSSSNNPPIHWFGKFPTWSTQLNYLARVVWTQTNTIHGTLTKWVTKEICVFYIYSTAHHIKSKKKKIGASIKRIEILTYYLLHLSLPGSHNICWLFIQAVFITLTGLEIEFFSF